MNKKWFMSLSLLSAVALAACGNSSDENSEGSSADSIDPLSIYTTVYPLQYFAERIAGDEAEVNSILPPGSDSHTYEPTSKDVIAIAEADVFIMNGAGLEGYADSIAEAVESEDVTIAEATEGIELSEGAHDHGDYDPHVWLDPVRSIDMAENIKELLTDMQPDNEALFEENFESLKAELEALDQEFSTGIEAASGNHFIVSHAAYGYWEEAYGVHQIAVSGLNPTQEPTQKELQSIVETAEEFGLQHVFFEQNITTKIAEIIREEIGAETLMLHNLSVLTDEDIENNEDYFSLMKRNLEQLNIALSAAPAVEPEDHDHDHDHDHGHDHSHEHDEEAQKIYDGYFEDDQIEDRPLSDWEGDWQSVYPYLQDGTLDEVFADKAEEGDKTAEEYKEYYTEGYVTDVDRIVIEDDTFTFYEDGEQSSGVYMYDGYEVLNYEACNRGVRYVFKLEETQKGTMPAYIQFSDHSISPTDSHHYHLYWGDDRAALLEEVVNWPTYYPSDMNGDEIAHEMMVH